MESARNGIAAIGTTADDRAITWASLAHVLSRVALYGHLFSGSTTHFVPDRRLVAEAIEDARPSVLTADQFATGYNGASGLR